MNIFIVFVPLIQVIKISVCFDQAFKIFDKMEHHTQSVDDALIGGLPYKLKAGASYVTNRRSVSYFASGGNQYSPNGVRVIKFNITGDQWLGPSNFHVRFQVNNLDHDPLGKIY